MRKPKTSTRTGGPWAPGQGELQAVERGPGHRGGETASRRRVCNETHGARLSVRCLQSGGGSDCLVKRAFPPVVKAERRLSRTKRRIKRSAWRPARAEGPCGTSLRGEQCDTGVKSEGAVGPEGPCGVGGDFKVDFFWSLLYPRLGSTRQQAQGRFLMPRFCPARAASPPPILLPKRSLLLESPGGLRLHSLCSPRSAGRSPPLPPRPHPPSSSSLGTLA